TGTSTAEVTVAALSGSGTIKVGSADAKTIGASVAGTADGQSLGSAYAKAVAINAASVPGLTATATNNIEFTVADTVVSSGDTYDLKINGTDIFTGTASALTTQQITDAINAQSSNTGVTAALSGTDLRLTAADGRDIAIGQTAVGTTGGLTAQVDGSSTVNGVVYRDGTFGTAANATNGST
ncbi:MAG: hypothetical protein CO066_06845, partial [Comamonadaceae bacterium CG_4_9_14_0_8_um_filter_60_18]